MSTNWILIQLNLQIGISSSSDDEHVVENLKEHGFVQGESATWSSSEKKKCSNSVSGSSGETECTVRIFKTCRVSDQEVLRYGMGFFDFNPGKKKVCMQTGEMKLDGMFNQL